MDYPKSSRGKFFAHKFVRLMMKSCAAQDMGQNAVLLCVFIAHTEDGRELCVLDWSPSVPSGEFVTVTIKALIRMPEVDQ